MIACPQTIETVSVLWCSAKQVFERVADIFDRMFEYGVDIMANRMYVRNKASHSMLPAERRMRIIVPETAGRFGTTASAHHGEPAHEKGSHMTANSSSHSTHLRITRRGRVVLTLLIVAAASLLAAVILLTAGSAMASGGAGDSRGANRGAESSSGAGSFEYVQVKSGQSLWDVAADLAPAADPRDVVSDIVHLNRLDTSDVQPGQVLAVPAEYAL